MPIRLKDWDKAHTLHLEAMARLKFSLSSDGVWGDILIISHQ
jgi:hypothetical protein